MRPWDSLLPYAPVYSQVQVKVKVKARSLSPLLCHSCQQPVHAKQSRIYQKQTRDYLCFNFYDCQACQYHYETDKSIVAEYVVFPRLDAACFTDTEQEFILPLQLPGLISAEVLTCELKK